MHLIVFLKAWNLQIFHGDSSAVITSTLDLYTDANKLHEIGNNLEPMCDKKDTINLRINLHKKGLDILSCR